MGAFVIFNYKISDLLEEVTKRTSYIGKMRGTEQEPYLVDRMSLTEGEDFMFHELLEEATHETYEWVKAFGRNIPMYDKIVKDYIDMPIYKNHGVVLRDSKKAEVITGEQINVATTELRKSEDNLLFVGYDEIICNSVKESVEVIAEHKIILHTELDAHDVYTELNHTHKITLEKGDTSSLREVQIPFEFIENGSEHQIKGADLYITIKVKPVDVVAIKQGTYVEYRTDFNDDSIFDLYKVNADCSNESWEEYSCKLEYDPRGCIVYILERKENFDNNSISSTDRALKESIVNRIIYLWFEYVNLPDAERYLLKADEYGQKAQIGMNARTKDIQRKYNFF
jgi:hypothetical protein